MKQQLSLLPAARHMHRMVSAVLNKTAARLLFTSVVLSRRILVMRFIIKCVG